MVTEKMKTYFLLLCVVKILVVETEGANVLMLSPFEPKSHRSVFFLLAKGLLARGHNVTIVGMFNPTSEERIEGINEITIPGVAEVYAEISLRLFNLTKHGRMPYFKELERFATLAADMFLDSAIARQLYQQPNTYDVAIVNGFVSEYSYPLALRVAPITTLLLPSYMLSLSADIMQVPTPLSYIPQPTEPYTVRMNFWERLSTAMQHLMTLVVFRGQYYHALDEKVQKRFPGLATVREVEQQVSLLLVNAEPGLNIVRPSMANVVDVGCMHCRAAKPLSGEIEQFTDEVRGEGFILFSLGSVLQASVLPRETVNSFLQAFALLKQKIIWKYEEDLPDLPSNVRIFKWLPQQDILGHPKLRLFITHSGLLGLQEAVYHGVPVLGLPVFADQPGNIARVTERGMGEELDLHSITQQKITDAINKILSNSSYKEAAVKCSAISRDQLQSPVERAVFWLEYVLRHKGAPHLKSAAENLNFFQYFLLDVIGVLLLIVTISIFIIFKLSKLIFFKTHIKTD